MESEVRTTAIVDPAWQGWAGILIIVSFVFMMPFGCGSVDKTPVTEKPPMQEKLDKLKVALELTKKRSATIQAARERMESTRVQLREQLTKDGVTAESKKADLSPLAKAHLDEFVIVVRDMKEMKAKYDESQGNVAQIEATIRQLERKLELDDVLVTAEDSKALEDANILLTDVNDRLNEGVETNETIKALDTEEVLKEQLGGK